jgi:hypothetical protein
MKKAHLFSSILVIVALLLAGCSKAPKALAPDAQPGKLPELNGDYVVNGFDPTGIEYGGRLKISPGEMTGTYQLEWIISGDLQSGIGVVEGNQLLVSWTSTVGMGREKRQGTARFTITQAGELHGTRQIDGYAQAGTETAYPNTPENMNK